MSEISRQEFQRRRQALVEQMQPGSAALIFAAPEVTRSADSEYPYRQNSDFWYFTGFNELAAYMPDEPTCSSARYSGRHSPAQAEPPSTSTTPTAA